MHCNYLVFSGGSDDKEYACNTGDLGSIPGLEKFPGVGMPTPVCLGSHMDRGAWQATVHGLAELGTAKQLTLSSINIMIIIVS